MNGATDPTAEIVGQRLRQLRELRGLSLNALAQSAAVAKSYLSKLERGEVPNPGVMTIARLAEALQTTLPQLLAQATVSHTRPRWSSTIDPLEMERIRESMPPSLVEFINVVEAEQGSKLPADVVRSLAILQFGGKRPSTLSSWRFLYEALRRGVD